MNARAIERAINYAVQHAWQTAQAEYADWVAEQCREVAAKHPGSTEAQTLESVAQVSAHNAERFRAKAIDFEVAEHLRVTDFDELTRRLTQQ